MARIHDIGSKDLRPPAQRGAAPEGLDKDLRADRIIGFAAGIAVLIAAAGLASWLVYAGLRDALRDRDPPPPPLPEARARLLPPEPRLQAAPPLDMATYRAREEAVLDSYGWVDAGNGTVHIPIERAIDLYLDRRATPPPLPATTPPAENGGAR